MPFRIRRAVLAATAMLPAALLSSQPAQAASAEPAQVPVQVYAAGSLKVVLGEVAEAYETAQGVPVAGTFGASGLLKERLETGAAADVFASANMDHPRALHAAGLAGPVRAFARNTLCALTRPGLTIASDVLLDRMLDPAVRLGTSTPKNDPAGDYAWELFGKAEILRPGSAAALDAKPDVLIDYTHPMAVRGHIDMAFARGIHVVIGTTGFFAEDFDRIEAAAKAAGVGAVTGNFSLTAALMQHLSKIAARYVPHWEIIEYAGAHKPDVPSGTARELAEQLGKIRSPHIDLKGDQLIGPLESRGATVGGAHVHSVRLPGCPLAVEVIFGLKGERLILRHDEQDNSIFVDGSLLAAQRITGITGLIRGLDELIFADH